MEGSKVPVGSRQVPDKKYKENLVNHNKRNLAGLEPYQNFAKTSVKLRCLDP
jgi:hypothetical protein